METEYVYGGTSSVYGGSNSVTYGRGWDSDVMKNVCDIDGESVYATVAEVDMFREGGVNPAIRNVCGMVRTQHSNGKTSDDNCDRVSMTTAKELKERAILKNTMKIATVDVHRCFDDGTAKVKMETTDVPGERASVSTTGCTHASLYASADKLGSKNGCSDCEIAPPPRRRDSGYDNNVGVKTQRKY